MIDLETINIDFTTIKHYQNSLFHSVIFFHKLLSVWRSLMIKTIIILRYPNVMSGSDLLSAGTAQLHSRSALHASAMLQSGSHHVIELLTAYIKA